MVRRYRRKDLTMLSKMLWVDGQNRIGSRTWTGLSARKTRSLTRVHTILSRMPGNWLITWKNSGHGRTGSMSNALFDKNFTHNTR